MVLIATMVLGVGAWAVWTFTQQARMLADFTDPAAQPIPVAEPSKEAREDLAARLAAFRAEAERGGVATFVASFEDLNTLLGFAQFRDLQQTLVWQEIDAEGHLVARVSLPMNSLPGRRVWFNGTITARLGAHPENGLYLATVDMQAPGRTVPPGFLDVYQRGVVPGKSFGFLDDMVVGNFRADPQVGPILRRIDSVTVEGGKITLTTKPKSAQRESSGW